MKQFLEVAQAYRKRGWSVVVAEPGGKRPIHDWREYQLRRATEEDLRLAIEEHPNANIGVVTGKVSGIVVIDIDAGTVDDPGAVRDEILARSPTDLIAKTGGGGYHLFYGYPPGVDHIRNRVRVGPGVDIRGDGGFVVVPPSLHASGECYEWVSDGEPGDVLPDFAIPRAPALSGSESGQGGDNWHEEVRHGVPEGMRNNSCAREVGRLIRKGYGRERVEREILEWNQRNSPPMEEVEVMRTIDSIYRTHFRREAGHARTEHAATTSIVARFNPVSLQDLLAQPERAIDWLVETLIPMKSLVVVAGDPKRGKTWVILELALALAIGHPLFDSFRTPQRRKVLVVLAEDGEAAVVRRFRALLQGRSLLGRWVEDRVRLLIRPGLSLSSASDMREVERLVRSEGIEVVMIDPYAEVSDGEENDKADMKRNLDPLRRLRDQFGVTVILTHHHRKSKAPGGRESSRMRGSSYLAGWADAIIQLGSSSQITKVTGELRDAPPFEPFVLRWETGKDSFRLVLDARFSRSPQDAVAIRIKAFLAENPGATKSVIRKKVKGAKDIIDQAIAALREAGRVWVEIDGQAHRHHLVEPADENKLLAPRGGAMPPGDADDVARGAPLGRATSHAEPWPPPEYRDIRFTLLGDDDEVIVDETIEDVPADVFTWYRDYRAEVLDRYEAWARVDLNTVEERLTEYRLVSA